MGVCNLPMFLGKRGKVHMCKGVKGRHCFAMFKINPLSPQFKLCSKDFKCFSLPEETETEFLSLFVSTTFTRKARGYAL